MFFRKKEFSSGKYDFIIAGLGNPGAKYEMTRHNAGFLSMDLLSIEEGVDIKKLKHHALCADMTVEGKKCLVMKPQTMMNASGEAIGEAAKYYKVPAENVIVVYDDISLDVGKTRIRRKGSAGGHNGIKSIIAHLGSENFPRVKVGVGKKPNPEYDLAAWVLGRFPKEQEADLKSALEHATAAVRLIVSGKIDEAMNKYNSLCTRHFAWKGGRHRNIPQGNTALPSSRVRGLSAFCRCCPRSQILPAFPHLKALRFSNTVSTLPISPAQSFPSGIL